MKFLWCEKRLTRSATRLDRLSRRIAERIGGGARRRIGAAALGLAILVSFGVAGDEAVAQTVSFKTSSGQVFEFQRVETLSCSELETVLSEISGANYRAIGRNPPNHPGDRALYDYEDRASRRLARKCGSAPKAQSFGRVQRGSNWVWGR